MARTRSRQFKETSGYLNWKRTSGLTGTIASDGIIYDETCVDTNNSPGTDHAFSLNRLEREFQLLSGVVPSGTYKDSEYSDFYPSGGNNSYAVTHLLPADSITAADFATLKSRTNPSRPVVTPLTLVQDLVDLPRMAKDVGRLLNKKAKNLSAKDIANQNLGIQFGWLPLIQDARHLFELQSHISKRTEELNKLYKRGSGLKRRITLSYDHKEATQSNQGFESNCNLGLKMDMKQYTQSTKWGTIRWKPTSVPAQNNFDRQVSHQAMRAVAGLTPDGLINGAWDVLPWSWLIDWMLPIQSYMTQHSNFIPAESSHACVMQKTVTDTYLLPTNKPAWLEGGYGRAKFTSLRRSTSSSSLFASQPYIGVRRLSILGSLFLQRFK
jgi:hypothetical protein